MDKARPRSKERAQAAALRQPLIVFECQNSNQPSPERLIATFEGPTFLGRSVFAEI